MGLLCRDNHLIFQFANLESTLLLSLSPTAMEPTASKLDLIMHPKAKYLDHFGLGRAFTVVSPASAAEYYLEPTACPMVRFDSFDHHQPLRQWRLDGVSTDGTRFFIFPDFAIGRQPMRIDLLIPEQSHHPPHVHQALSTTAPMFCKTLEELRALAFTQHLLNALQIWSSRLVKFEEIYFDLPFGSCIAAEALSLHVETMGISYVPSHDTEQEWLSVEELSTVWHIELGELPTIISLEELSLQSQPHESISIVTIPTRHGSQTYVFKSILKNLRYLYHELYMLLSLPSHKNIIRRPLYMVHHQRRFGGLGVCGFIVEHYPMGTLQDALWQGAALQQLCIRQQCQWARQITEALIHIKTDGAAFYTGLRPNNIVLQKGAHGPDIVLLDFEQRTGRYTWSPPEIRYVSYLEHLVASETPSFVKDRCRAMLRGYFPDWKPDWTVEAYDGAPCGYSAPWLALSPQQKESAQVFMLGKLIWCIFEGVGAIDDGLNFDTFKMPECDQPFPEFRQSHPMIRKLVQRCTAGAPEWRGRRPASFKLGTKLHSSAEAARQNFGQSSEEITLLAAQNWWEEELQEAERFFYAFSRLKRNARKVSGDEKLISCLQQRPSLNSVLITIQDFERMLE